MSKDAKPALEAAREAEGGVASNPVITALFDMAVSSLSERLREMFEKADDLLFESANKARAGDEQRLYIDAMSVVRGQRPKIIQSFKDALRKALAGIDVDGNGAEDSAADDSSQWSLQDGDELEERIAVNNMQTKASSLHAHELVELQRRLSRLADLAGGGVSAESLSPLRIIRAFQDSMSGLEVDFPVKLVIYKLFDRVVVERLSEVFVGANQLLAVHGVEPRLDGQSAPRPTAAKRVVPKADLSSARAVAPPWATESFDPATLGAIGSGMRRSGAGTAAGAAPVSEVAQQAERDLAMAIGQILSSYAQGDRPAAPDWLPPQNVALVARMFDKYYRDLRLNNSLKPMLARLQMPITKLALSDGRFFEDRHHPGRRAVSDLFEMLLQFSSVGVTPSSRMIHDVATLVDSIVRAFDIDAGMLADVGVAPVSDATANQFLQEQEELQQLKNRARVERVRRIAAYELRMRIGSRKVSEGVMRLMLSGFGPLLCLDYIRNGVDGASWNQTMQLVDRVLRSLYLSIDEPEVRAAEEAEIVASISRRLSAIGFSESRLEEVLSGLLQAYLHRAEAARRLEECDTLEVIEPVESAVSGLTLEQELQGLMSILLVPGAWFTIWEPVSQTKHWVRAKAYYPERNLVLFGHYMEERFLHMHATAFATELVEGRAIAIDPSSDIQRMIERLRDLPFERMTEAMVWTSVEGQAIRSRE